MGWNFKKFLKDAGKAVKANVVPAIASVLQGDTSGIIQSAFNVATGVDPFEPQAPARVKPVPIPQAARIVAQRPPPINQPRPVIAGRKILGLSMPLFIGLAIGVVLLIVFFVFLRK